MDKILKILNIELGSISQTAVWLAVFTLASQIVGLFRDRLLAGNIGAGETLDIYYAAFKVPDLIFPIAASLASVTILIPYLLQKLEDSGLIEAQRFMNIVFSVFFVMVSLVAFIVGILMPFIAPRIAPGFDAVALEQLVSISRIILLSPILLGVSNLFATVTQAFNRFVVYGLAPILYNVGIILGLLFLYPKFGLPGLATGVIIGAFLHMVIQIPVVVRQKLLPRFTLNIDWRLIKEIMSVSLPRTLALWMHQLIFIALVAIASTIQSGSISLIQFGYVLQSVPVALIGMSYSIAAFPILVRYYTQGNLLKFQSSLLLSVRQIIFWSIPLMVLFIVLRAQIVRVVLGTGSFTWDDTRLTAAILALFLLSIVAQGVVAILVRGFYAAGQTWRPFFHNLISSVFIITLAIFGKQFINVHPGIIEWLAVAMRVENISGVEVLILPAAFSLGLLVNALILWISFRVRYLDAVLPGMRKSVVSSFLGSILMGAVTFQMLRVLANFFDQNTFWGIFLQGFIAGVTGMVVAVTVLWYFKNREVRQVISALRGKFWKSQVISD